MRYFDILKKIMKLIKVFEMKIKERLGVVWGVDSKKNMGYSKS